MRARVYKVNLLMFRRNCHFQDVFLFRISGKPKGKLDCCSVYLQVRGELRACCEITVISVAASFGESSWISKSWRQVVSSIHSFSFMLCLDDFQFALNCCKTKKFSRFNFEKGQNTVVEIVKKNKVK